LKLKPGVEIACMSVWNLEGILTAHEVYVKEGQTFTITSLTDGTHGPKSLHYKGRAFDLRTKDLKPNATPHGMAMKLRAALGGSYDVVVESDHLHIEYQPK
jgi:hypothetical protein